MKIKTFLMRDNNITRATFFWNAFSAAMNSFQTMVLLLIITRTGNMEDSSIFVMAYAVGNLMINIGKYGVRQFQVTDVNEKYSFHEYIRIRYISMLFMLFGTAAYLIVGVTLNNYSKEKTLVILMICLLKGIEAFEDVYHGRMQQQGRLDVAGRILGIRLFLFILGFGLIYTLTHNLLLTCAVNLLISMILFFVLNFSVLDFFKTQSSDSKNHWKSILIECFPLCVCMCLNMYIGNAPKYTIDAIVSNDAQTCFNIIFMPVFVISLLGNFIFQPLLKNIGEKWEHHEIRGFLSIIIKLAIIVIITDAVITLLGSLIGCQILGWIYGVQLEGYRGLLTIFLIVGGIIALQNLFIMAITAIRYQKYMIYGYVVIALIMLFLGKPVLLKFDLTGLSLFFLAMMTLLAVYCIIIILFGVQKQWNKNTISA